MKKLLYILVSWLFLTVHFISLKHIYDSDHFFSSEECQCEQCNFVYQAGSTQVPDMIVLQLEKNPDALIADTSAVFVVQSVAHNYFSQAPPQFHPVSI